MQNRAGYLPTLTRFLQSKIRGRISHVLDMCRPGTVGRGAAPIEFKLKENRVMLEGLEQNLEFRSNDDNIITLNVSSRRPKPSAVDEKQTLAAASTAPIANKAFYPPDDPSLILREGLQPSSPMLQRWTSKVCRCRCRSSRHRRFHFSHSTSSGRPERLTRRRRIITERKERRQNRDAVGFTP